MSSIKRIIQAIAVGVVLMQLATGFCIATVGAQEPGTFPAEEFDINPNEMDLDFGDNLEFDQQAADELTAESAAALGVMLVVYGVFLAVCLAIAIFILWFLSSTLAAVPRQYRDMEPGMVWLLLIPLFNIVWIFFVTGRISSSYQRYFAAQGVTTHGDCGAAVGMWYCICTVLGCIPCVNLIALVLLIVYLVKVWGMKKEVLAATGGMVK